ncbi:MAG TPA: hypothetical protein VK595_12045 [Vicinamibacterales bacterium]|nr:hypothetical protein [Vicinamibacterales bacterium]
MVLFRRSSEIVEAGIGSVEYLALHVSETQDLAGQLREALEGRPGIDPRFLDALTQVASYEVRL